AAEASRLGVDGGDRGRRDPGHPAPWHGPIQPGWRARLRPPDPGLRRDACNRAPRCGPRPVSRRGGELAHGVHRRVRFEAARNPARSARTLVVAGGEAGRRTDIDVVAGRPTGLVRALLQRTTGARVRVGAELVGEIGPGLVVLLGVGPGDDEPTADALARRVTELRIFDDDAGRTNLSLTDVGGAILVVSQFTLYADTRRGRRPGFTGAAPPELAERLYLRFA